MKPAPERIQKVLARAGAGSRREVEAWIEAGRLSVNGQQATPGQKISARDKVRLDGQLIRLPNESQTAKTRVLMYHKPVGEVCTRRDEKGRRDVFAALPPLKNGRWINVGRLDINTSGLLLLTNDGELANRLMHPSGEIEREYAVRVIGKVDKGTLTKLQTGVQLEDGPARFETLRDGGGKGINHWYHVTIREGRNREIRRLWESQGISVSRLMRVRFGTCSLPRDLRPGSYRELDQAEVGNLFTAVAGERSSSHKPRVTSHGKN